MIKRLVLLSLLSVLLLSACSNIDDLSGKTFDVSVIGSPNEPGKFQPIMTLEFSDGNIVKNTRGNEEGTYELNDDKLLIHIEDENEKVEIEFTLEESNHESNEFAAVISDSNFQMEDSEQVSKYKGFYLDLSYSHFEFIQK